MTDDQLAAFRSLVTGVEELQDEWPSLPEFEGRINDLCGFLFATLPLSQKALKEIDDERNDRSSQGS